MKLSKISLYGKSDQFDPSFEKLVSVTDQQIAENSAIISDKYFRTLSCLFYLVLDGKLILKRPNDSDVEIGSEYYQTESFVEYRNDFKDFMNTPIEVIYKENSLLLQFMVDSIPIDSLSVKARKLSNSTVDISTKDDSVVIVIGKHIANGKEETKNLIHYRIMDNERSGFPLYTPSGTMTISTSDSCYIVLVERNT
jgi:hypothetical protein